MKAVYVDCTPAMAELLDGLEDGRRAEFEVHFGDPTPDALARLVDGAAGVLNGHTPMPRALLEAAQGTLRTIVFLGTGAGSYIDLAAAADLAIPVRVIPGYGDRAVAEHAFALLLAAARNLAAMDRDLRAGTWRRRQGPELAGKTLGVVGTGGIGAEMVRMAAAFGMRVVAWNRSPIAPDLPCAPVTLPALFETADAASLHLALNDETHSLISAGLLARAKPGFILINTARAGLADDDALLSRLEAGTMLAGLDVFDPEPLPPSSPLLALDTVTLSPHAAWNTPDAARRLLERGLALLWADLAGSSRP